MRISRRGFLAGALAAGVAACSGSDPAPDQVAQPTTTATPTPSPAPTARPTATPTPTPALARDPFTLGVASGDPLNDAVVLWTRLHGAPEEELDVEWQLASDPDFASVEASGVASTDPSIGHAVHVDATGLRPSTPYWYRFRAGGYESPVGRTSTTGPTDSLRLAVACCQGWQSGHYTAYPHLVADDVDLVLFLGDYIYELEAKTDVRPHDLLPARTLEEFRAFYELHRTDAQLQAAHAAVPWIATWDDHEVEDNYAGLEPGAVGSGRHADGEFAGVRAAAYQAWWEHMPVRAGPPRDGGLPVHRSFTFGDLATMPVLDTRQYRSPIPAGEGAGNLPRFFGGGPQLPAAFDENATMLGAEQERWLESLLVGSSTRWNLVAHQSVMAQLDRIPDDPDRGFSMDSWDGYVAPRRRLLDAAGRSAADLVALGGDIHTSAVADLRLDYADPEGPVVGSELIAPSLTSIEVINDDALAGSRSNPHVHLYEPERRGYLVVEINPDQILADYRWVSTTELSEATIETGSSWVVNAGQPGAAPA